MRTTVIPAQITTVEDKIAGNFNLTQIVLLLVSLFVATFIYAVFPQRLHFSIYKIVLIIIQFLIFILLSLRIRGRIVLNWLFILSSYYLRPGFYIYSKNDTYLRDMSYLTELEKKKAVKTQKAFSKKSKFNSPAVFISDLSRLERLLLRANRSRLSFKFDKNGGMNAIWQIKG